MTRVMAFVRKDGADRRMLVTAAALHVTVAVALRMLSFARVRQALGYAARLRRRQPPAADVGAGIVQAVRTAASVLPGGSCLTEALVAQCLFAWHDSDTTLRFGISRERPTGRPFDAHAWLERDGAGLIGARALAYDPLRHPGRCDSSRSPR